MTGWLLGNMAWATVVMLLILAVRRPIARFLGAGTAYALWLLVPLRLAMPPLPASAEILSSLLPPLDVIVSVGEAAAPLPPDGGPGQWVPWLLAIWAGGAAAMLVHQWLAYRRFLTGLSLRLRSVGVHGGIPLVESGAVKGPLALGLLDRRIVIPEDFGLRYSRDEQRLALDHEATHHRRGDIWCNHAALLVLALLWFNPIAWLAFRAFREDQELSCDSAVAARAAPRARHDYALALIKSASRSGPIAACPLNRADQLKRRLKMMNHHRSSRLRLLGGAAALLGLGGISIATASSGVAHPHPEGEDGEARLERVIIMDKGDGTTGGERRRHHVMIGRGEDGELALPRGCEEGSPLADIDESSGERRTHVLLCGREGATPAERAEILQRARDRLAQNDAVSDEHRQRIIERLDQEIVRARGQ